MAIFPEFFYILDQSAFFAPSRNGFREGSKWPYNYHQHWHWSPSLANRFDPILISVIQPPPPTLQDPKREHLPRKPVSCGGLIQSFITSQYTNDNIVSSLTACAWILMLNALTIPSTDFSWRTVQTTPSNVHQTSSMLACHCLQQAIQELTMYYLGNNFIDTCNCS